MNHWENATVTDTGAEMLNEWLAGRSIKITSAYGGTGTVDPDLLTEQTDLLDRRQALCLLEEEDGPEGKTVPVQLHNADVAEEYELNQVGVFAKLDPGRETETEERLLFIMQDERGVAVPAASDASFLLELYCLIGITNDGRFTVDVSAAGIVTLARLRQALAEAFAAHNADPSAHPALAARLGASETALADVDARLGLLELMYRTQAGGNSFAASFGDLAGMKVTGVWNAALKRLEF